MEKRNYRDRAQEALILSLDRVTPAEGLRIIARNPELRNAKVNSLVDQCALVPSNAARLRKMSRQVGLMLDFKLADIPSTSHDRAIPYVEAGVRFLTVLLENRDHMKSAKAVVKAAKGSKTKVIAVGPRSSSEYAAGVLLRTAELAAEAGAHGIVCSRQYPILALAQHESREIRTLIRLAVSIGLPSDNIEDDDQFLRNTPEQVIGWGAHYVIAGRSILRAGNMRKQFLRYLNSIASALRNRELAAAA